MARGVYDRSKMVRRKKIGRPPQPAIARFNELFIPEPNTGCWLWAGNLTSQGYGSIRGDNQKPVGAHRFSYQAHKGAIPSGLLVCHKCDVRICVNPDHLYAGSYADNVRDMHRRGGFVPAFSKTPYELRRTKGARP